MKFYLPILTSIILWFGQSIAFGQQFCGTLPLTTLEKQASLTQYQVFKSTAAQSKNARQTLYRVAVRPTIIYENAAKNGLTEADVRAIIAHANTYLSNANIELYLLRDSVKTIVNKQLADFQFTEEKELRAKNDVSNAINIYFLKMITQADSSILNGYTNFPSLSASTNRIFYSYNDRSTDDYTTLYNKTFLHELGHYFGLLHTFQDSDDPNIALRELVTRTAGSNCSTTGDLLCDTPADPFERLPILAIFGCSEQVPKDLTDANGDSYSPPVDNIMSYNFKCGNVFTNEQYQKMQASFAIRFSPAAEYSIVNLNPNSVGVVKFDKKVYCVNDSMKIDLTTTGLYEANNQFLVDISDKTGSNFTRISSKKSGNQLLIKIPNLPEGDDYRVQIMASNPQTISPNSENFSIRTFMSASLSTKNNSVFKGDSAQLVVNFSGSGT